MISNLAKEIKSFLILGTISAYSDRRGKKNKYSSSQKFSTRIREKKRKNKERSLYDGCG